LGLNKAEVLDLITCAPDIAKLDPRKVNLNIVRLRDYLKLSNEEFKNFLLEYPIVLSGFKNIEKIEFYMNLYLEMSKEEFFDLVKRYPLLLISDVKIYIFNLLAR
jgi:hypothetical protein